MNISANILSMTDILLTLLCLLTSDTVRGQFQFGQGFGQFDYEDVTTPSPFPQPTSGNLTCYSCSLDFRYGYENLHPCLGRHGEKVHNDYLVACGVRDLFCKVERTEVNGVLTQLVRSCSDVCYYGCRPRGLGIQIEVCADCCDTDRCNDFYPLIDIGGRPPAAIRKTLGNGGMMSHVVSGGVILGGLLATIGGTIGYH